MAAEGSVVVGLEAEGSVGVETVEVTVEAVRAGVRACRRASEVLEADEMEVQLGVVTEAACLVAADSAAEALAAVETVVADLEAEGSVVVETVEVTVDVDLEVATRTSVTATRASVTADSAAAETAVDLAEMAGEW